MRVDPSSNAQSPIALTQADGATQRSVSKSPAAPGAPADNGSFAMTEQLTQLLGAVSSMPDVRPEAVASASAKLASGELNTPQAATDTAGAMLNESIQSGQ